MIVTANSDQNAAVNTFKVNLKLTVAAHLFNQL